MVFQEAIYSNNVLMMKRVSKFVTRERSRAPADVGAKAVENDKAARVAQPSRHPFHKMHQTDFRIMRLSAKKVVCFVLFGVPVVLSPVAVAGKRLRGYSTTISAGSTGYPSLCIPQVRSRASVSWFGEKENTTETTDSRAQRAAYEKENTRRLASEDSKLGTSSEELTPLLAEDDLQSALHIQDYLLELQSAKKAEHDGSRGAEANVKRLHSIENWGKFLVVLRHDEFTWAHHLTPRRFLRALMMQLSSDLKKGRDELPRMRTKRLQELEALKQEMRANDLLANTWIGDNHVKHDRKGGIPAPIRKLSLVGKQWDELRRQLECWTEKEIDKVAGKQMTLPRKDLAIPCNTWISIFSQNPGGAYTCEVTRFLETLSKKLNRIQKGLEEIEEAEKDYEALKAALATFMNQGWVKKARQRMSACAAAGEYPLEKMKAMFVYHTMIWAPWNLVLGKKGSKTYDDLTRENKDEALPEEMLIDQLYPEARPVHHQLWAQAGVHFYRDCLFPRFEKRFNETNSFAHEFEEIMCGIKEDGGRGYSSLAFVEAMTRGFERSCCTNFAEVVQTLPSDDGLHFPLFYQPKLLRVHQSGEILLPASAEDVHNKTPAHVFGARKTKRNLGSGSAGRTSFHFPPGGRPSCRQYILAVRFAMLFRRASNSTSKENSSRENSQDTSKENSTENFKRDSEDPAQKLGRSVTAPVPCVEQPTLKRRASAPATPHFQKSLLKAQEILIEEMDTYGAQGLLDRVAVETNIHLPACWGDDWDDGE